MVVIGVDTGAVLTGEDEAEAIDAEGVPQSNLRRTGLRDVVLMGVAPKMRCALAICICLAKMVAVTVTKDSPGRAKFRG